MSGGRVQNCYLTAPLVVRHTGQPRRDRQPLPRLVRDRARSRGGALRVRESSSPTTSTTRTTAATPPLSSTRASGASRRRRTTVTNNEVDAADARANKTSTRAELTRRSRRATPPRVSPLGRTCSLLGRHRQGVDPLLALRPARDRDERDAARGAPHTVRVTLAQSVPSHLASGDVASPAPSIRVRARAPRVESGRACSRRGGGRCRPARGEIQMYSDLGDRTVCMTVRSWLAARSSPRTTHVTAIFRNDDPDRNDNISCHSSHTRSVSHSFFTSPTHKTHKTARHIDCEAHSRLRVASSVWQGTCCCRGDAGRDASVNAPVAQSPAGQRARDRGRHHVGRGPHWVTRRRAVRAADGPAYIQGAGWRLEEAIDDWMSDASIGTGRRRPGRRAVSAPTSVSEAQTILHDLYHSMQQRQQEPHHSGARRRRRRRSAVSPAASRSPAASPPRASSPLTCARASPPHSSAPLADLPWARGGGFGGFGGGGGGGGGGGFGARGQPPAPASAPPTARPRRAGVGQHSYGGGGGGGGGSYSYAPPPRAPRSRRHRCRPWPARRPRRRRRHRGTGGQPRVATTGFPRALAPPHRVVPLRCRLPPAPRPQRRRRRGRRAAAARPADDPRAPPALPRAVGDVLPARQPRPPPAPLPLRRQRPFPLGS